ncbi:glycoside hydrolase family protein [Bradyrhizobium cenepequi]
MSARKTAITVASAGAIAMAVPMVKTYEGLWLTVKPDKLARGLPTGGYGETENVTLGETHDEKYWAARLAQRLPEYDRGIGKCIKVDLPDGVRAVAISLSYNGGVAAVCRSPMVAKWNAGQMRAGCNAIYTEDAQGSPTGWYIRSGGEVRRGLINRRKNERAKCLAGIKVEPPKPAPPTFWQKVALWFRWIWK